jgi:predicted  nucleic acid-binding Zn-ribbon protein
LVAGNAQSRSLGLLPNSPAPEPTWVLDKYILELKKVPETIQTMDIPDIPEGTSEASVNELTSLINEEDRLGQEIGSIRRRLNKLDQLSSSIGEYGATLTSQEDRLQGVGWFEKNLQKTHKCPVCEAEHTNGNPRLDELKKLAEDLKALATSVYQAPAKLDKELADLRQELRRREGAISKIRQKRKDLERQSAILSKQRQHVRQIYLFVGRVEQALENVGASRNVDDLRARVNVLALKIAELKKNLDPSAQRDRLNAALDTVSAKTANYAKLLQLEHAVANVRLNLRELTLQFSPLSGRTDFLWEVGAGQNWVGYHVAGLLALHEHFISLANNPVPRFLVIDQPSQVYFPAAWPSMEQTPNGKSVIESSSDIDGVRRIFSALSHFMNTAANKFQIIVTEHAGSITWDGIPNVHLVGNWRKGYDEFLIPHSWKEKE